MHTTLLALRPLLRWYCLIALLCCPMLLLAQQDTQQLYESMLAAYQSANFGRAAEQADLLRPKAEAWLAGRPEQLAALWQNMAVIYTKAERWADAEDCYRRSLDIRRNVDPNAYASTALQLAQLYWQQSKTEQAIALYEQIVAVAQQLQQLSMPQVLAQLYLAHIWLRQGKWQQAEENLRQADDFFLQAGLTQQSEYIYVLVGKGHLAYEQANYAEAKRWLQAAVQHPGHVAHPDMLVQAHIDLALIEEIEGFHEAALRRLQAIQSQLSLQTAEGVSAHILLARLQLKMARHTQAQTLLQQIAPHISDEHPWAEEFWKLQMQLLVEKKQYAELLKLLAKEPPAQKSPQQITRLYNRAQIEYRLERWADAWQHTQQALQLCQQYPDKLLPHIHTLAGQIAEEGLQNYELALQHYQQAAKAWQQLYGKQSVSYWLAQNDQARLHLLLRQYEQARQICEQAIPQLRTYLGPKAKPYADALATYANCLYEMALFRQAEQVYEQVVDIYRQNYSTTDPAYFSFIHNLANIYANNGQYSRAEQLYVEALTEASARLGDQHPLHMDLQASYALLLQNMGYYETAVQLLQQNVDLRRQIPDSEPISIAAALLQLGTAYYAMGRYAEAQQQLEAARQIYEQQRAQQTAPYTQVLYFLYRTSQRLGQEGQANIYLQQCLQLREQLFGKQHPEYAALLYALADRHEREGNYQQAEQTYHQAINILKQRGEHSPDYIAAIERLANLYKRQGKNQQALQYLQKVHSTRLQYYGHVHPATASAANNLAIVLEATGKKDDIQAAEQYYLEALHIFEQTFGQKHPDYITTLNNLAIFYEAAGQVTKAALYYEKSIDVLGQFIRDVFPGLSEKERRTFYYRYRLFYENFFWFAARFANNAPQQPDALRLIGKAYDLQMQLKGILLTTSGRLRAAIEKNQDPQLIAIYQQWQQLRQTLANLYTEGWYAKSLSDHQIDSLEQVAQRMERTLSQKSAWFAMLQQPHSYTQLLAYLKPGEAALELIRIQPQADSIYYIGLLLRAGAKAPTCFVLPQGDNIERYINYHRNSVKFRREDTRSYEVLWKPIQEHLQGIKRLYFSADGGYYQINPYALLNPETNRYVIDDIELVFVTATRDLLYPNMSSTQQRRAALFANPKYVIDESLNLTASAVVDLENQESRWLADVRFMPLPGTDAEVRYIQKKLQQAGWRVDTYTDVQATEEKLKNLSMPNILHIATHGFFIPSITHTDKPQYRWVWQAINDEDNVDPMLRSGLVMAGVTDHFLGHRQQTKDDGLFTAYEAAHLDLSQTQLVVLSACETGLGKVQNGEGVYGLQRAFLLAGAQYVVMSLWRVDDAATQELMTHFYDNLLKEQSPPLAFRKAQLALRQRYKEPYYWAAFLIVEQ